MITPLQMKMARHCIGMTTRQLGAALEISHVAVSRYERGDTSAISAATAAKAEDFFTRNDVFFGAKDGICLGENVFATEAWMRKALLRLLEQAGIKPSSTDLINAAKQE